MTVGALAAAKAADSRQVMDAILADLQALASSLGGSLLANGGQRITQRGAGPFTAAGAYAADRWLISPIGGSAVSVTVGLTASPPPRCDRYAQLAYTHAGGGSCTYEQLVESWPLCKGQPLALGAWVWADHANMARLALQDGVSIVGGAYHPGDSTWRRLAVAATADAAATTLKPCLQLAGASGTARFTGAMLLFGTVAPDYVPRPYAEEQALCERYYEVQGGGLAFPYLQGPNAAAEGVVWNTSLPWRAKKGGTPTVSRTGTWTVTNAGQPSVLYATPDGAVLQIASAGSGYFTAAPDSADDLVVAEWNPS